MAKEPLSKRTSIKVTVGLLITVGLTIAAMSAGWVDHNSDIEAIGVKTDTMKVEGCDPAKKTVTDVAVIKTEVAAIKEDVREMRIEQRIGKQEILTAIKESK